MRENQAALGLEANEIPCFRLKITLASTLLYHPVTAKASI
jgi:hypothetical protein